MAAKTPSHPPTSDDVGRAMADIREHMGGRMHTLGNRLLGMAGDANAAVAGALRDGRDAAQAVGGMVQGAVTSAAAAVRRAADVRGHVRRHPWLAVGCAAALGFWCAGLLGHRREQDRSLSRRLYREKTDSAGYR